MILLKALARNERRRGGDQEKQDDRGQAEQAPHRIQGRDVVGWRWMAQPGHQCQQRVKQ